MYTETEQWIKSQNDGYMERERGMTTWIHTARTESYHDSHQACGYYHVFYYMLQHVVVVYEQVQQR